MKKIISVLFLIFCSLSLFFAFTQNPHYRLYLLISSGIFLGFYYGLNNNEIYHAGQYDEEKEVKFIALIDACWKHVVCGILGSVSLYLLSSRTMLFTNLNRVGWVDLILFLTAVLAYTGFLPLTLTVFAVSGKLIDKIFKN